MLKWAHPPLILFVLFPSNFSNTFIILRNAFTFLNFMSQTMAVKVLFDMEVTIYFCLSAFASASPQMSVLKIQ